MDGIELVLETVSIMVLLGVFLSALARLLRWRKTCRPSRRFLLSNLLPGLVLAVAVTAAALGLMGRIAAEQQAQPVHTVSGVVSGLESRRIPGRYSTFHMYYILLEGDPNRYHALFLERRSNEFLAAAGTGPVVLWYTGEGRTREARAVQLADGTFFHTLEQSQSHDVERAWAGAWVAAALFLSLSALAMRRPPNEWARPEAERRARREGTRHLTRLLLLAFAIVIALFALVALLQPPPVIYPASTP